MVTNINDTDPCLIIKILFNRSEPNEIPIIRDTSLFFAIIGEIYVISAFFRFIYYKNKYDHLKVRSYIYVISTTLGACFQIASGVLYNALAYKCWIYIILAMLVIPLLGFPVPLRMLDHLTKHVYTRAILEYDNISKQKDNRDMQKGMNDAISETNSLDDSWIFAICQTLQILFSRSWYLQKEKSRTELIPRNVVADISSSPKKSKFGTTLKQKPISFNTVLILRFMSSATARLLVTLFLTIPFISIIISGLSTIEYEMPINDCHGCRVNNTESNAIIFGAGIIIFFGIVVAILVRHYPDPFGIMTECRISMQYGGILSVVTFYLSIKIPHEQLKIFSFSYLTCIGMMLIQFAVTDLQIIIAKKQNTFLTRTHIDSNDSRVSSNLGVTENEKTKIQELKLYLETTDVKEFEEYLIGEYSVEHLRMYQDCIYFETHYFDMNDNTRKSLAKRIYEKYIVPNSILEVNLPETEKEAIKTIYNKLADQIPQQNAFKRCHNELLYILYGSWVRFQKHNKKLKKANP